MRQGKKMKTYNQLIGKLKDQRGVTAVIVAILVFLFVGIMALAIDVGYFHSTKNELQNIADAAALAGAGKLGNIYLSMSPSAASSYVFEDDRDIIEDSARTVVGSGKNPAGGKDIIDIPRSDVEIGTWDPDRDPKFIAINPLISTTSGGTLPDAVRVTARRDAVANSPVGTFFGKIFGLTTQNIVSDAVAALTAVVELIPGEMKLPIGLSEMWFETNTCGNIITFSPTTDSCAGWHNFFDAINANAMKDKLISFINNDPLDSEGNPDSGDCILSPCGETWLLNKFGENNPPADPPTPGVIAGDSFFEFQGGTISALFNGESLAWEVPTGLGLGSKDFIGEKDNDGDGNQDIDGSGQIAAFPALFDYFRFRDGDGVDTNDDGRGEYFDNDDDTIPDGYLYDSTTSTYQITHPDSVWSATVPVYKDLTWEETGSCMNPNTSLEIIGFARVVVIKPNPPPDSTVTAIIDCNLHVISGVGGGSMTGNIRAGIPNLVE
jgi:hypothetical protein